MTGRDDQGKGGEEKLPWYYNLYNTIKDAPSNLTQLIISAFISYKVKKITREQPKETPRRNFTPNVETVEKWLPLLNRDYTVNELMVYDGTKDDGRILLAVNFDVFDVSSAAHFYGPSGAYPHYAGCDISRNLLSMDKREGFDFLSDLTGEQMIALLKWNLQYKEKYPVVGRLVPTQAELIQKNIDVNDEWINDEPNPLNQF